VLIGKSTNLARVCTQSGGAIPTATSLSPIKKLKSVAKTRTSQHRDKTVPPAGQAPEITAPVGAGHDSNMAQVS
jgi:hypothetical protein